MAKVLGIKQLLEKKYKEADLSPEWKRSLGNIEPAFIAIIFGTSGSGKTNFTIMLAKELSRFGVVLYNSHEEGHGKTIQDLALRHNLADYNGKIRFLDNEKYNELVKRLAKKHSPKIVVMDSIQYSAITTEQYKALKEKFKKKIISHSQS